MTTTEFLDSEHVLMHEGVTFRLSEHACMGFTHGAWLTIELPSTGIKLVSQSRVHTLPAYGAKEYKRFPVKRYTAWLYERFAHTTDSRTFRAVPL